MAPVVFKEGDVVIEKGKTISAFYVIQEGTIRATDITIGNKKYEDVTLGPGHHFGERAILTGDPSVANGIAQTDGVALKIDKETFTMVLGDLSQLILKSRDKTKLVSNVRAYIE